MLTPEQIDKEAERIKEEYDYMDDMPLDGWMWEFIRRTKEYPELFEAIKKENSIDVFFFEKLAEINISFSYESTSPDMVFYHVIPGQIFTSKAMKKPRSCVPHYQIKYSRFGIMKPRIYGLDPVRCSTFSELDAMCKKMATIMLNNPEHAPRIPDKEIIESLLKNGTQIALQSISPHKPLENIFYVGISMYGQKQDIMKRLEDIVDQYIKPSRNKTRDDKWKNYIIVYDLIKDERLEDATIAKIFDKAFPKLSDKKHTKNEIKRWYDQARLLIEARGYKDFLMNLCQRY